MKELKSKLSGAILIGLVALLVLTAAVPLPGRNALAAEKVSDLARLTVINNTSGTMYLWLDGPQFYYFVIPSDQSRVYTIERGVYDQTVRACGDTASDSTDLTKQTTMIMPVCGANANAQAKSGAYDLSNLIKIVRVKVENDATSRLLAILTGPATYVFLLDKDEVNEYTIARGDYTVQYWACGKYATKEWSAYTGALLKLSCPKS